MSVRRRSHRRANVSTPVGVSLLVPPSEEAHAQVALRIGANVSGQRAQLDEHRIGATAYRDRTCRRGLAAKLLPASGVLTLMHASIFTNASGAPGLIDRLLLGSVRSRLLRHTKCPVLIVPQWDEAQK
jgi:universal stress protein family protein